MEGNNITIDVDYDELILIHNLVLSYNKSKVGREVPHKDLELRLLRKLVENE